MLLGHFFYELPATALFNLINLNIEFRISRTPFKIPRGLRPRPPAGECRARPQLTAPLQGL